MSIYDEITHPIIAELEQGVPPWAKSWSSHVPMNIVSQKEYRGINILLLWKASQGKFTSPYWLTYRQAESLGGYVRQGEKATSIVYAASGRKVVVGPDEQTEEEYFFLKYPCIYSQASDAGCFLERAH